MSLIGLDKVRAQHNGFLCQSVYLKQWRANLLDFLQPWKVGGLAAIQIS